MSRKERRTAAALGRRRKRREQRKADREIAWLKKRIQTSILTAIDGQPALNNAETFERLKAAVSAALPPLPTLQLEPLPSTPEEREARTISFKITGEAAKRIAELLPKTEAEALEGMGFAPDAVKACTHPDGTVDTDLLGIAIEIRREDEDAEAAHALMGGAGDYTR